MYGISSFPKKRFQKKEDASSANGSSRSSVTVYLAILIPCGYSQVPGVDFNEKYAPGINDVSFCVM